MMLWFKGFYRGQKAEDKVEDACDEGSVMLDRLHHVLDREAVQQEHDSDARRVE